METIRLGNRMYDPFCCSLILPYSNDGCHSKLMHLGQRGRQQNVTTFKFCTRLLFERGNDFNILIHSGRLLQQYVCEMFVKVGCERFPFLRQNQKKLSSWD